MQFHTHILYVIKETITFPQLYFCLQKQLGREKNVTQTFKDKACKLYVCEFGKTWKPNNTLRMLVKYICLNTFFMERPDNWIFSFLRQVVNITSWKETPEACSLMVHSITMLALWKRWWQAIKTLPAALFTTVTNIFSDWAMLTFS